MSTVGEGGTPWATRASVSALGRRIQKDLAELNDLPLCFAGPKGDILYQWTSTILGPQEYGVIQYQSDWHVDTNHQRQNISFLQRQLQKAS